MKTTVKLYFFCGKMGAGKTTYATTLAATINAVYLSEDELLSTLYPTEIKDFNDYITYSVRIKPMVQQMVSSMVTRGVDVVMDFPANTKRQRAWLLSLVVNTNADHELLYLQVSDEVCLQQIAKRRVEQPERHQFDTEDVFHHVTSFFEEPSPEEGFNLKIV